MKSIVVVSLIVLTSLTSNILAQQKMSTTQKLDPKQECIVAISTLTAIGTTESLKGELNRGLESGLTINEIKEVLVQLYAYCGFPRSLNGIITFMAVVDERKSHGKNDIEGKGASPISNSDKYQTGKQNLQTLTGKTETTLTGANAFAPAIDIFLKEHLFADIFSRDVLSFQQRELVTISALAAMQGVAAQLQAHVGMAMNTGLTEIQIVNTFLITDRLVSISQGDIARASLKKVLAAQK